MEGMNWSVWVIRGVIAVFIITFAMIAGAIVYYGCLTLKDEWEDAETGHDKLMFEFKLAGGTCAALTIIAVTLTCGPWIQEHLAFTIPITDWMNQF